MFRRFHTTLKVSRNLLLVESVAGIFIGTFYYSQRMIHGDDGTNDSPGNWSGNNLFRDISRDAAARHRMIETAPYDASYDMLRENGVTALIEEDTGISRFDVVSVPSHIPQWNVAALRSVRLNDWPSWTFLALFDGYNGWETNNVIVPRLISTVVNTLVELTSKYEPPSHEHTEVGTMSAPEPVPESYPDAVNKGIKDAFLAVDDAVVKDGLEFILSSPSKAAAARPLSAALSGSSVLLSFYDLDSHMLRVALTGNSRAVLGRLVRTVDGKNFYKVHVLTTDQTPDNHMEEERLSAMHPGEDIFGDGKILGCSLSRAFGLAAYKWSNEIQKRIHREYLGDVPLKNIQTPPYLTAEPDITAIEVQPGDFLVMASSGLWSSLTNEEAVGLVGLWLDNNMHSNLYEDNTVAPVTQVFRSGDLPISLGVDNSSMYRRWHAEKKFLCIDRNAASHLARNALGGADRELTAALINMGVPRCRRFRHDINVAVVFFED